MQKKDIKQSLLMGALASSFGIFISKILGLFYYSPLSEFAGEANMAFYSWAYNYYDTLLQISAAGIPFAIAAMVARYTAKQDYKTVLLVKKLGTAIIMGLSVVVSIIFVFSATPLAKFVLGESAPIKDIETLRNLFYILTVAIITVPFLSATRGYVQGLKRLDIYGASQVLEQFIRVFTILIGAFVIVKILKLDSIYAIYVAIAAASIGAIVAIAFTIIFSKKDEQHVLDLASNQKEDASRTKREIISEILTIGIPFLINSFLSSAGPLVNSLFFLRYMTAVNGQEVFEASKLAFGILNGNIGKLSNIPSVLALGFGSGMVPYLSESLEKNDNHKITAQINQILDTVTIILIPMTFIFVFFARDIYYIMYGNYNLDLGTSLFKVSNIQIFLGTIVPVFSSIMMSLKLRKQAILTLIISFLIKLIAFFPLVKAYGAYGMIYSSGIYYVVQILMYFYYLRINFGINIKGTTKRFFLIIICSIVMIIPAVIIHRFTGFNYTNRIEDILIMFTLGIVMLVCYYNIAVLFGLPQKIYDLPNISSTKLIKRLLKKGR